jgi:hypothetical protein
MLEGRAVPAGFVTAPPLSATGVLTINGDDDANIVTILLTGAGALITPDAGTSVNGGAVGAPALVSGTVKSIVANFKGGADDVSIDGTAAFTVPGAVSITLGDGDNVLNMSTTGKIDVGSLIVKGTDGSDTVTVQGGPGAGSQVKGATSFNYANGGSVTTLRDMRFGVGVSVIAGESASAPNEVIVEDATIVASLVASLSNSLIANVSVADSKIGGLKETGYTVAAVLQNTTVTGAVNVKGLFNSALTVTGSSVGKNTTVSAPLATFAADGAGSTITGNLLVTGSSWTTTSFQSSTLTEVKGAVTVTGGWFSDVFSANGEFRAAKTLTLNLKGGDNDVTLGDGSKTVTVAGNLTIKAGAGSDRTAIDGVSVLGTVVLTTLQGNDTLAIDGGSSFAKTFSADLGSGNDTFEIALNTGGTVPVTFTGVTKLLGNTGDDALFLGLDAGSGGDAGTKVAFNVALNDIVDGGAGFDFFDSGTADFTGTTVTGWDP